MKSNKKEVEKKAKEKKFSKITIAEDKLLKVIIVILVLVVILLVAYRIFYGKSLATDDKLVKELHSYLMPDDLNNCDGLSNYADKKITSKDLTDNVKLCLAYQKASVKDAEVEEYDKTKKKEICKVDDMIFGLEEDAKKCSVAKVKKDIIDDAYYKLFGENIKSKDAFNYDNMHICYLKDDYYYCGRSETYTYIIDGTTAIYRIIDSSVEKGSTITIYDYFLKINNNECYTNYTTLDKNDDCTKNYTKDTKIDYNFMKKYGAKYKHIYKKDKNGTYYWVSSTPVK